MSQVKLNLYDLYRFASKLSKLIEEYRWIKFEEYKDSCYEKFSKRLFFRDRTREESFEWYEKNTFCPESIYIKSYYKRNMEECLNIILVYSNSEISVDQEILYDMDKLADLLDTYHKLTKYLNKDK